MAGRRIQLHPLALREATEAYTEQGAPPEIARNFKRHLRASIARIQRRPETYPRIDGELRRYLLTPKYPYGVLYEVLDDETIYVLAVMHLRRHCGYWRGR